MSFSSSATALAGGQALPKPFPVTLRSSNELSPGVKEFWFERTDGAALDFEAGQWVNLMFPLESGEIKRAYSIASEPDGTGRFELAVTHVKGGPGSSHLHAMRPGDCLTAVGPHGLFVRRSHEPAIFVGTGTGITPLRSMFKHALLGGHKEPLWLLLGARRDEDRLYHREFAALAEQYPNFHVEYTLSQGAEAWQGRRGYVQTHLREFYLDMAALQPEKPHVYICGLTRMVTAVRDLLRKEMGLERTLVHSERYD